MIALRRAVKYLVPGPLHAPVGRCLRRARHFGYARTCPVCCSHVRGFRPHGIVRRADAVCPVCESRERHRLAWVYIQRRTRLLEAHARLLHVAPETELSRRFRAQPNLKYVTTDIGCHPMIRSDIIALPFRAESFDAIYCSHVLNMIPTDGPAITELYRVLRRGGFALLQVPIGSELTAELPAKATPDERLEAFNDPGMFRVYGIDFVDRLKAGGFNVVVERFQRDVPPRERVRYGLHDEALFLCRK